MALTPLHVRQVCSAGTPCRYLETTFQRAGKPLNLCMKLAPNYYEHYSQRNPYHAKFRTGDNCPGHLYLRHKRQGIDVREAK